MSPWSGQTPFPFQVYLIANPQLTRHTFARHGCQVALSPSPRCLAPRLLLVSWPGPTRTPPNIQAAPAHSWRCRCTRQWLPSLARPAHLPRCPGGSEAVAKPAGMNKTVSSAALTTCPCRHYSVQRHHERGTCLELELPWCATIAALRDVCCAGYPLGAGPQRHRRRVVAVAQNLRNTCYTCVFAACLGESGGAEVSCWLADHACTITASTCSGALATAAAKLAKWRASGVAFCSTADSTSGGRSSAVSAPSTACRSEYSCSSLQNTTHNEDRAEGSSLAHCRYRR